MKSYRQFCGVARALDVLGERWTLLIVRDLLLGPRRFSDLQRSLHGITPNLLTKRLAMLEEERVVERVDGPTAHRAYGLTERGRSLEGVVLGLGAFGASYLVQPLPEDHLDPRWAMLSLKRRYRPSKVAGDVTLVVGDDAFAVRFGGSTIDVRDGVHPTPDVTLRGPAPSWFGLLARGERLETLEQQGALTREGPARVAGAFVAAIGARP